MVHPCYSLIPLCFGTLPIRALRFRATVAGRAETFFITATMKIIKLSRGLFTIVDNSDFESLNAYSSSWHAQICNGGFYAATSKGGETIYMHRLLLGFPINADHKNGLTLDNRRLNLRAATRSQNLSNFFPSRIASGGYIGVRKRVGPEGVRYTAYISNANIGGIKFLNIGVFNTAEEAAIARDQKAYELRGEFAALNFPNGVCRTHATEIIQP
jgi:hypothetical protein